MKRVYLCIDLKSFYASCECVLLGLDSMTTDLVVADKSRGDGTICLAVSASLKQKGVKNRCRLYQIDKKLKYIIAKPRMSLYIQMSASIYKIYLKYVSKDDILVYSIDECFLDITNYLDMYKMTPYQLGKTIIDDIYKQKGICATCGIGTNMFLAKVSMDIVSKHVKNHIGFLDEELFKKTMWYHTPITDFWNIGAGIATRLKKYGVNNLHDITLLDEKVLYKEFGVNAEYLIDHAYGKESCTIKQCHEYKSKSKSISNGQVLFEDYSYNDGLTVVKEMVEQSSLQLIDKHLVSNNISLYIGYSKDSYHSTGGSIKLSGYFNSYNKFLKEFINLYLSTTNPEFKIRRINIGFNNLKDESYLDVDLFDDNIQLEKEYKANKAILEIQKLYGKNSILKATNLLPKATTRKRNNLIGGHNSI